MPIVRAGCPLTFVGSLAEERGCGPLKRLERTNKASVTVTVDE